MRRCAALVILILSSFFGQLQGQEETVYFLVGKTFSCGDGYVLPLDNPDDIAHARELVKYGPRAGQQIVVAKISRDVNGINVNRNYCVSPAPSWSWYVTEFLGFADRTIEILDGTPTQVEDGTFAGNRIGFWTYTVRKELGTDLDPWCEVLIADCAINWSDLEFFSLHWMQTDCKFPNWCGSVDLDVSGSVDFLDFALLANRWVMDN